MARDPDTIQHEIEHARDALASTLDQLGTKADPRRAIESARTGVQATLQEPKVRYPLIGVGALIVLLLLRKLFR